MVWAFTSMRETTTHSQFCCMLPNSIHNDGAHTRNSSTKTDCYWVNSGMQWFI